MINKQKRGTESHGVSWSKLGSDKRAWVWAAYEQMTQHVNHNAWALNCAANGWRNTQDLFDYLSIYGVRRGNFASYITDQSPAAKLGSTKRPDQRNLRFIVRKCVEAATEIHNGNDAGRDIDRIIERVALEIGKHALNIDTTWKTTPRSAVSKILACHCPKQVTLFDRQAVSGLKIWFDENNASGGVKPKTDNFFSCFEHFYECEGRHQAQEAVSWLGGSYNHFMRVADKYLWLLGAGNLERSIRMFDPRQIKKGK